MKKKGLTGGAASDAEPEAPAAAGTAAAAVGGKKRESKISGEKDTTGTGTGKAAAAGLFERMGELLKAGCGTGVLAESSSYSSGGGGGYAHTKLCLGLHSGLSLLLPPPSEVGSGLAGGGGGGGGGGGARGLGGGSGGGSGPSSRPTSSGVRLAKAALLGGVGGAGGPGGVRSGHHSPVGSSRHSEGDAEDDEADFEEDGENAGAGAGAGAGTGENHHYDLLLRPAEMARLAKGAGTIGIVAIAQSLGELTGCNDRQLQQQARQLISTPTVVAAKEVAGGDSGDESEATDNEGGDKKKKRKKTKLKNKASGVSGSGSGGGSSSSSSAVTASFVAKKASSMVRLGVEARSFDVKVPRGKWTHIALVATAIPQNKLTLYMVRSGWMYG
jgi:hypothetical protein